MWTSCSKNGDNRTPLKMILRLWKTGGLFLPFFVLSHNGIHHTNRLTLRLFPPDSQIHGSYYEYFEILLSLYT